MRANTAKGIKAAKLKRLPVAVPPLAEQRRIIAKVEELTALCDRLEAQIEVGRAAQARLLEVILRDALVEGQQVPTTTSLHRAADA